MVGDVKEDSVEEVCFFSREGLFLCLGDIAGRGAKSPYIRILLHDMGTRIRGMIESIGKEEECGHGIRRNRRSDTGLSIAESRSMRRPRFGHSSISILNYFYNRFVVFNYGRSRLESS